MDKNTPKKIAELVARAGSGDRSTSAALLPMVYDELRALAVNFFKQENPGHTLQPTALVHEVFVRLAGSAETDWRDRAHFFAVAARAMRRILIDYARRKKSAKRGGKGQRITLSGLVTPPTEEAPIDLIALDEALATLCERSPRQGRIVEMRFLAGLDEREVAHVLDLSHRTVQREWRMARAFLRCELSGNRLS
jgi:RNA polymerase sigma-70 factor, ECF subfamily